MSADSWNLHDSQRPGPQRATRPRREHVLLFGTGAGLLLLAGAAIYVSSGLLPQADGYAAAPPAMHGGDTTPLDPLLRPLLLSPLARRAEAPEFRLPRVEGGSLALADLRGQVVVLTVFANGVKPRGGRGPPGFQPDVFGHPPRDPGYSPLRAVHIVTWKEPGTARLLTSAAEVREAEARGEIAIEQPGVVVNMPFLTWPRGRR